MEHSYKQIQHKSIAFSCLDWGMGHLTRSIQILKELIQQNNQIHFFGNEQQLNYLKHYLPSITYVDLNGYNLKFKGKGNWGLDLWKSRKQFFKAIQNEKESLKKYALENPIDYTFSDHRYGFYLEGIPSFFITHQLHLPISKIFYPIQLWHEKQLNKFNQLLVLDDENNSFAGKLSKKIKHDNIKYIGIKSRYYNLNQATFVKDKNVLLLTGPQPYTIELFEIIKESQLFKDKPLEIVSNIKLNKLPKSWNLHLSTNPIEQDKIIQQSKYIVSRTGYSTLMDIEFLKCETYLIPTKGQKEQLYLSKLHKQYNFPKN